MSTSIPGKALAALAAGGAATGLLLLSTTLPATMSREPARPAETTATAMYPGPPNYPNYAPQYEEAPPVIAQTSAGLNTTPIVLGGIALAGAAVGITLIATHRRNPFVPGPTTH